MKISKHKYILIGSIVILLYNMNVIARQSRDWELKENSNGIIVHTRENKETGFIEFKATVTINTSIDTLLSVF